LAIVNILLDVQMKLYVKIGANCVLTHTTDKHYRLYIKIPIFLLKNTETAGVLDVNDSKAPPLDRTENHIDKS